MARRKPRRIGSTRPNRVPRRGDLKDFLHDQRRAGQHEPPRDHASPIPPRAAQSFRSRVANSAGRLFGVSDGSASPQASVPGPAQRIAARPAERLEPRQRMKSGSCLERERRFFVPPIFPTVRTAKAIVRRAEGKALRLCVAIVAHLEDVAAEPTAVLSPSRLRYRWCRISPAGSFSRTTCRRNICSADEASP